MGAIDFNLPTVNGVSANRVFAEMETGKVNTLWMTIGKDPNGGVHNFSLPLLAERYHRHALDLAELAFGPRHPLVSGALCNLADFLVDAAVLAAADDAASTATATATAAAAADCCTTLKEDA